MSLAAGATLLGAVGHLANLGQFVEIGQGHAHQKEQMQWARRAYCLDSRALRIDLLNAVKEDVRDHHQTYAGRIDTLLLVHTLLLTFALATLQYSDQFVPSSDCDDCAENLHPWLVLAWVYSVSAILILPFWSMIMLIWSKLQLDRWLETSLGRLNLELRASLSRAATEEPAASGGSGGDAASGGDLPGAGSELLNRMEDAVGRLSEFVVEHQESFKRVWGKECRLMIQMATVFLWVSCVLAISITAGMFWLFLQNRMGGVHAKASTHFAVSTICGLLAPAAYALAVGGFCCSAPTDTTPSEAFEDCIEAPLSLSALRTASAADGSAKDGSTRLRGLTGFGGAGIGSGLLLGVDPAPAESDQGDGAAVATARPDRGAVWGAARATSRAVCQVARLPAALWTGRRASAREPRGSSAREPFVVQGAWARMDDDGGLCMPDDWGPTQEPPRRPDGLDSPLPSAEPRTLAAGDAGYDMPRGRVTSGHSEGLFVDVDLDPV